MTCGEHAVVQRLSIRVTYASVYTKKAKCYLQILLPPAAGHTKSCTKVRPRSCVDVAETPLSKCLVLSKWLRCVFRTLCEKVLM
jgi:hypothetical protein